MIYVDQLSPRGAPWAGGISCHMISDTSEEELLSFAALIGLHRQWLQPKSLPHFDLSATFRRRAIAAGAIEVGTHEMARAMRRFRAARAAMLDR